MYRVVILPLAKKDIRDAALWYQNKQNGLGQRFITDARERVRLIQQHPKLFQ